MSAIVYEILKDTCQLQTLVVRHVGNKDTYFCIEHSNTFNPSDDEDYEYEEITEEEFKKHYLQANKIINNIVPKLK